MKLFLQRHAKVVTGVLSGFDRLVLRGSLRLFVYAKGLLKYLCHRGIKLKDFGRHSRELSDRIIAESQAPVERVGRPVIYLPGSQDRKDDIAREIAQRDRIEEGTICVLKTVSLPVLRGLREPADPADRIASSTTQVFALVPLPDPSGVWIDARAFADLVSLRPAGVPQWPGVAQPTARCGRHRLCAGAELLHAPGQPGRGPAPDGPATPHALEAAFGPVGAVGPPHLEGVFHPLAGRHAQAGRVLLDHAADRVGQRRDVHFPGRPRPLVRATGPSRHDHLRPRRRAAVLRPESHERRPALGELRG